MMYPWTHCTRTLLNYQVCMQDGETSKQIDRDMHPWENGSSELSADLYRATLYKWRKKRKTRYRRQRRMRTNYKERPSYWYVYEWEMDKYSDHTIKITSSDLGGEKDAEMEDLLVNRVVVWVWGYGRDITSYTYKGQSIFRCTKITVVFSCSPGPELGYPELLVFLPVTATARAPHLTSPPASPSA